jgi:Zn-dependent peptidase ImmA (M78 family)
VRVSDKLPVGIEGITDPHTRSIVVAESVFERMEDGDGRARNTVLHECGHGLMHVKQLHDVLIDGRTPGLQRASSLKPYLSPEWQANSFASALLMPAPAFRLAVARHGRDTRALAALFGVSPAAVGVRLDLLHDGKI